jgi:hypothetical protein
MRHRLGAHDSLQELWPLHKVFRWRGQRKPGRWPRMADGHLGSGLGIRCGDGPVGLGRG